MPCSRTAVHALTSHVTAFNSHISRVYTVQYTGGSMQVSHAPISRAGQAVLFVIHRHVTFRVNNNHNYTCSGSPPPPTSRARSRREMQTLMRAALFPSNKIKCIYIIYAQSERERCHLHAHIVCVRVFRFSPARALKLSTDTHNA
jgi:hypothetical protein